MVTIFRVEDAHDCATTLLFRDRKVAFGLTKAVPADALNNKKAAVVNFIVNELSKELMLAVQRQDLQIPVFAEIRGNLDRKKVMDGCLMALQRKSLTDH